MKDSLSGTSIMNPLTPNHSPSNSLHDSAAPRKETDRCRSHHIYGGLHQYGFNVEFCDFSLKTPFRWGDTFADHSLQICINLHGDTTVEQGGRTAVFGDNKVAVYTVGEEKPKVTREARGHHCFYTLTFSRQWLFKHMRLSMDFLKPEVRHFIEHPQDPHSFFEWFTLPLPLIPCRIDLLAPPVHPAARETWYYGKIFEILALAIYVKEDAKDATEMRNRERADRVRSLIEEDYQNLGSLKMLAKAAKCSPFHLSRIFKKVYGISISDYHQAIRMEKASEFLRGGMTVTETSSTVGYSNISAFIAAFSRYHQTTPSRWLASWKKGTEKNSPSPSA